MQHAHAVVHRCAAADCPAEVHRSRVGHAELAVHNATVDGADDEGGAGIDGHAAVAFDGGESQQGRQGVGRAVAVTCAGRQGENQSAGPVGLVKRVQIQVPGRQRIGASQRNRRIRVVHGQVQRLAFAVAHPDSVGRRHEVGATVAGHGLERPVDVLVEQTQVVGQLMANHPAEGRTDIVACVGSAQVGAQNPVHDQGHRRTSTHGTGAHGIHHLRQHEAFGRYGYIVAQDHAAETADPGAGLGELLLERVVGKVEAGETARGVVRRIADREPWPLDHDDRVEAGVRVRELVLQNAWLVNGVSEHGVEAGFHIGPFRVGDCYREQVRKNVVFARRETRRIVRCHRGVYKPPVVFGPYVLHHGPQGTE